MSSRIINTGFRSPLNNIRYTRQLFFDCQQSLPLSERVIEPRFTLHHDVEGLINFRRAYVEMADTSGYKMAQRYLEDFSHWQLLMKGSWFREAKALWDEELDAKLASEGLDAIRILADGIEGVQASVQLSAAKYLADRAKKANSATRKVGRPTAEEVAGEIKNQAAAASELEDDAARIRLVKG